MIYELTTPCLRSWSWSLLFDDIKTLHEGIKGSNIFFMFCEKDFLTFLARFTYTVCFIVSPLGEKSSYMKKIEAFIRAMKE